MQSILIAIDGDAAAGKTTLASTLAGRLQNEYEGEKINIIPMDHFFLPQNLRTQSRLDEPGGNVHYERFKSDVLIFLLAHRPFAYRPFNCQIMDYDEPIHIAPASFNIIEGSYSHHPTLCKAYSFKLFVSIDPEEQMRRIIARNGEAMAKRFQNEWIPMEKAYHKAFGIKENSNLILDNINL